MPLTALDPITALVIIDLQAGIAGMAKAHPMAEVVQRSRELADAFRQRGLPVVLVNVDGVPPGRTELSRSRGELPSGFADLLAELGQQPSDHVVTKQTAGAFTRTDLESS